MFDLLMILLKNIGMISIMAIIITRLQFFRSAIQRQEIDGTKKLILIVFFGLVGIYGTYSGVTVEDAVANSRVIGPFVGGLFGGPVVGLFAGLIAGIHRYLINPLGFSSLACVVITPLQGVIIGLLRDKIRKSKHSWQLALLAGAIAEVAHMSFVLLLSRPFEKAVELVEIIGYPMIIANSIGIATFIVVLESVLRDRQSAATHHAQRVLEIAKETLVYLRNGLNPESTDKAARIILKRSHLDAVSFTDTENVLTHVGIGAKYHRVGDPIQTTITKSVLASGAYRIGPHIHEHESNCPIKTAIVVPIKIQGEIAGTFKMYTKEKDGITPLDVQLALGLTNLFSQQLELELIEKQYKLLKEAEYHALQSQINPHFLFNALNTISSVVRTSSERGRELLLSLADYLRGNMNFSENILLKEELVHVKSYLDIELERFGDKLQVVFDVDDVSAFKLPPLTLQPIVENAVKHGVRARKQGGEVVIKAEEKGNFFVITVSDDGVGMSKETVQQIFNFESSSESVGLMNIHQRLIARYGEHCGLNISSEPDKGTVVTFQIPKYYKNGIANES